MARRFTCGFEEGDTSWTATMWTSFTDASSLLSYSTDPVISGVRSLQAGNGSSNAQCFLRFDLASSQTSGTIWVAWKMRFELWPTTADGTRWMAVRNSSDTDAVRVVPGSTRASGDHFMRLVNQVTATTVTSDVSLSLDKNYFFVLRYLLSSSAGELELKIYEESSAGIYDILVDTLTISGENTLNTNVNRCVFGHSNSSSAAITYFDDIKINDDSGSFQNSAPGYGAIEMLVPDSDVSVAWTKAGSSPASTNFGGVNDLPGVPNDGTAYNSSTSGTQQDRLGLTALSSAVPSDAVIVLLDVYGRQGSNGTSGTRNISYNLWDESGTLSSATVSASINGWRRRNSNEALVVSASGKTKANIADYNVGYTRSASGSNDVRVTAIWVQVEWQPPAGEPPPALSGTFDATLNLSASLLTATPLRGAFDAAADLSAALTASAGLSTAFDGALDLDAALEAGATFSATFDGALDLNGALGAPAPLEAQFTATLDLAGSLTGESPPALSGNLDLTLDINGALGIAVPLRATLDSALDLNAALGIRAPLSASWSAELELNAALHAGAPLRSQFSGQLDWSNPPLAVFIPLRGDFTATLDMSGRFFVLVMFLPPPARIFLADDGGRIFLADDGGRRIP